MVEDDADPLDLVEMILRQNGFVVIKANREVSIREIAGIKPSLAIFDVLLPFGLGTEMCLAMKNDPMTSHIPVMLYSAGTNLRALAEASHADAYLAKPFDIEELIRLARQLAR